MLITRAPGIYFAEEVLERALEGGIVLDGVSRLVALSDGRIVQVSLTTSTPRQVVRRGAPPALPLPRAA